MVHAWYRSTTLSSCSLGILELRASGAMDTQSGPTVWPARASDLNPFIFLSPGTYEVYCLCYRTCNNEYRMDLKWLEWYLEFSSESDSCCSDVKIPALEPKVDTLGISFSYPEAANRQPRFRRPMFMYYCVLVLWHRFTFCKFVRSFLFQPLSSIVDLGQLLIPATYRIRWRSDNFVFHRDTRQEIWAHYGDNASTSWCAVYRFQVESKFYFTFILCLFRFFSPCVGLLSLPLATVVYTHQERSFPYGYWSLVYPLLYSAGWLYENGTPDSS